MKALSVRPEYTFDIFMGEQTYEERTWQTDYRGDLLICASSKKEPGYVNGHAYFVIPLLDIKPSDEEWYDENGKAVTMYEWTLGAPRAIQPIPVKGKLHLYDVDDALIHYVEGGDLGAYSTKEEADAFREAYIAKYLDPLAYNTKDSGAGVTRFDLDKELNRLFDRYREDEALIIGYAYVREPICLNLRNLIGLTNDAAFLESCKAFMEIAHNTFHWNDYLDARMTAEATFRAFYDQQRFPKDHLEEAVELFIANFFNQCIDERQFEWEDEHPNVEMPEPPKDDINNLYLARLFSVLNLGRESEDTRECIAHNKELEAFCDSIGVRYHYEQLHMCCWFAGQITHGSGHYSRDVVNYSARITYNRLLNPYSLLWIGAAMGADREKLQAAAKEMASVKENAAKCGIVRRYVPFDDILELYNKLIADEEA